LKDIDIDKVYNALYSLAIGSTSLEVVEEYINGEDGLVLKSRKTNTKHLTPDLSAIKLLLAFSQDNYENMTEEELEEEKKKLLSLLTKSE